MTPTSTTPVVRPYRSFVLSAVEVDVLGRALRADVRQFPLQVPGSTATVDGHVRLAEAIDQRLRTRGLSRLGRLAPELVTAFGLFGRFRAAIAVIGTDAQGPLCARAMADGTDAVVISQDEHGLRFDLYRSPEMVLGTIRILSPLPPAPGESVTITAATTDRPRTGDDEFFSSVSYTTAVRPSGRRGAAGDPDMVRHQFTRSRAGGGYFVVIGRDHLGRERTAPGLGWLDSDLGRMMSRTETADDGRVIGTYTPADNNRIGQALAELVRSVWARSRE